MPGGVEHDGANFAGQNGGGPLLLADDDPAGKHLVAGLHHAQTVVGNIDQHVPATGELIHQIATPQVAQQQAGAHLRAGIEPGAGLTTDNAVRGETVTTLELLDGLLGITIVNLITMARGAVAQLVEHGADLAELGGALSGTQGRHIEGWPLAGHRHCQQFVHFSPHRLVFRHLRAQGFHLGEQVIIAGLGHYRAVQIELEGLHLLARDQIHPRQACWKRLSLAKMSS